MTLSDSHGVYARMANNDLVRVWLYHGPMSYNEALAAWQHHDDARLAGRRPHVKWYAVRDAADPAFRKAPHSWAAGHDLVPGRGHKRPEPAGRKALLLRTGKVTHVSKPAWGDGTREQGLGGWFYYDGRTFAQGLHDLARRAQLRGWVAQTPDERWHVVDPGGSSHPQSGQTVTEVQHA